MEHTEMKGSVWVRIIFFFLFGAQLLYSMTWILARPLADLPDSGLAFEEIPEGARSFINNHGVACFSSRGTIPDDPISFAVWIGVVVGSIACYRFIVHKTGSS
jgi:hypothetical protein